MSRIIFLITCFIIPFVSDAQELWSLQKCIDYAYQKNIELKQSELNVETAEINKNQAYASALPSINASANSGWNWGRRIDPFSNEFATQRVQSASVGMNAGFNIFSGFQTVNTIKQSQVNLEASAAYLEQQQYDVALNVANAYLTVLFTKELLKIAESNLTSSDQQVDRVAKLVNVGSLPEGSLNEIEAEQAADEAAVIIAENNLDIAYLNLAQIMNMPFEESENFAIQEPVIGNSEDINFIASPQPVINNALNSFPMIRGAEADLESSQIGLSISRGGYSPRLSMSYSYGTGYSGNNIIGIGEPQLKTSPIGFVQGSLEPVLTAYQDYDSYETKNFGDQIEDNLNSSLFISLSIPIFNGLQSRSSAQRAVIQVKNAEYQLENTKLRLTQEVQRAWTDARAAMKNHQAAEKALAASEKAFEYAEVRYEQGVINTVEYQDARMRLDRAKSELARNKYDFLFKVKVLEYYQGQPITLR